MAVASDADKAMRISMNMQKLAMEITEMLTKESADSDLKLAQSLLLMQLIQLRGANRDLWQNSRSAKSVTGDARAQIDSLNLELQGVYYEQRHLQNEIKACKETPTIYQDITMIPEEEFIVLHPAAKDLSPRDLMHARLQHEKDERLKLEAVRKDLLAKKAALIAENKRRKNDLESLEAQLQNFVSTAENIKSIFKKY